MEQYIFWSILTFEAPDLPPVAHWDDYLDEPFAIIYKRKAPKGVYKPYARVPLALGWGEEINSDEHLKAHLNSLNPVFSKARLEEMRRGLLQIVRAIEKTLERKA